MLTRPKEPLLPDARGYYGEFGGAFVPEILRPNIDELADCFATICSSDSFWWEFQSELHHFSGRPTPLTHARRLSGQLGGAQIYLKREDLGQTGAHKINNVIGQGMLARRLGKTRVIAETGAGQHGVATATMAARFGLEAVIYMGAEDVRRQRPNVFWMEQMGAKVVEVADGTATLKDAINEAMRDWSANLDLTHYVLGTACGPHPYPAMVSYFQSVIGLETAEQCVAAGMQPQRVYGCVGGGSNALGIFQGFLGNAQTQLVGCEAGGLADGSDKHSRRFHTDDAKPGIAQGYKTLFLQNDDGQMQDTYSVAAGLDYVGVSPILAHLFASGRVQMQSASDAEVLEAIQLLMRSEGIIPALESSHALACAFRDARALSPEEAIVVNLSGRGDKDIFTIAEALDDGRWRSYLADRAKGDRDHV